MSKELAEVIVENGIMYRVGEHDLYYPELSLEQKTDYPIGKYGIILGEYLMEYHRHWYLKMIMAGIWNEYLHEIDEVCHKEVELAVERIKKREGVTEKLKAENPLEWVGEVNGITAMAEEVMLREMIFGSVKNEF